MENRESFPSEPPLLPVGTDFDGRYRIEAQLGAGGIGLVYRATDMRLSRPVAVKVLRDVYGALRSQRQRFAREAKALAQLVHPNVVTVLDYGVARGTPYLVMELLEGQSLGQLLKQTRPLPVEQALDIAGQLLGGLCYVHGQGLLHRDLKPDNVFLQTLGDGQLHVKLLDFGLAKFLDPARLGDDTGLLTRSGERFGTPGYMPPEQMLGQTHDGRVDVYSATVILFEMLAGRRPFRGTSLAETVRLTLDGDVPQLSEVCPTRSPSAALSELLARGLARDPDQRFADASELSSAVQALPADCVREVEAASTLGHAETKKLDRPAPDSAPLGGEASSSWSLRARLWVARLALAGVRVIAAVSFVVILLLGGVIYIFITPGREQEQAALRRVLPERMTRPTLSASPADKGTGQARKPVRESARTPDSPAPEAPSAAEPSPADAALPGPEAETEEHPAVALPGEDAARDASVDAETSLSASEEEPALAATEPPQVAPETQRAAGRPAARNPWESATPRAMRNIRRAVVRGGKGGARTLHYLRRYARAHPNDGRANLLLGGLYLNRLWARDGFKQYQWAYQRDPSLRGDPHMLSDLLGLASNRQGVWRNTARFIVDAYGTEALSAVGKRAASARDANVRKRLSSLLARLQS